MDLHSEISRVAWWSSGSADRWRQNRATVRTALCSPIETPLGRLL